MFFAANLTANAQFPLRALAYMRKIHYLCTRKGANSSELMEISLLLEYKSREELRQWLIDHHATSKECWVTMYRTKIPRTDAIPYLEVAEEALCFGWIDSTLKKLPDGRLAQRLSSRRKGSHWTELNKERCRDLESRGLMTDSGRMALERTT